MPPPQGFPNPLEGPGDYTVTSKVHNDTYPAIDPTKADLSGKVVALVGVSRGIGRSIAISFAKAGASYIAIGARSDLSSVVEAMQHAAKAAGRPVPKIMPLKLDVTAQQSTEDAAATIEKEFGKCDILVNNAGILGETNLITDSDPEEWWRVMDVNLRGPYLVIRAMLPLLLKGGDKTIVNVSSAAAHLTFPTASTYQISKLALLRLSEFVMSEYGSQGVLSYCVHPGNVPTDIFGPGGVANLPDNIKCVFVETPEIGADTMVYLTKEKRDWLAGRYINVTWDMPELMAKEDEIVQGDKLKVKLVL